MACGDVGVVGSTMSGGGIIPRATDVETTLWSGIWLVSLPQ